MQTQHATTDKKDGIFLYLLFLTLFFLLLEISLFVQYNKAYLYDFTFVSSELHIPSRILPGIFFFIGAQLTLHLAYCVFVWLITCFIASLIKFTANQKIVSAIGIWLLGIMTILFANQYFFPNSKFVDLTSIVFPNATILPMLFVLSTLFAMCILLALVGLIKSLLKSKFRIIALIFIIVSGIFLFVIPTQKIIIQDAATKERPNIFLIGVDALRPDFLSYFGNDIATPFFDNFLNQSAVFTQAVTPLARTFPSWTSILSGEYPRQIGIRSNLASQQNANLANTLPAILQRQGYNTIYAIDDARFSNIDKNFGFDEIITPPMGLNDFLLGTFNDFPISNLVVNTRWGRWLFPYSYANRPAYITYEPDSFLQLLHSSLPTKRDKPVFMSVHFCLPHFPYAWASLAVNPMNAVQRYTESVKRVDQQLSDFFILLQQQKLLDHAIVILLSDHGEALELSGDRLTEKDLFIPTAKQKIIPKFYPPSLDDELINQSAGHGTDVLGLSQYHSLFAVKLYGVENQQPGNIAQIVSLLDVKPTILNLLNLPISFSSGRSLAPVILGTKKNLAPQHIFLETDFSPQAIRTVYPETQKVLLIGVHLFQIDPITTRLTVKDSMNTMIIKSKQYADIYGEWMLALYPQDNKYYMPILINLVSGRWTNDLTSSFAQQSPEKVMLASLQRFYGKELGVLLNNN